MTVKLTLSAYHFKNYCNKIFVIIVGSHVSSSHKEQS